jgi:glycosyltransferase involved in cell wall biosynthesis
VWEKRLSIRLIRFVCGFVLQRDYFAEREFRRAKIDLVFQHQAWYGYWFKVPTLAWIADFQHRRVPAIFSKTRFWWRDIGYRALSRCATRLMVSSEDAKRDCEAYYPKSRGRISVLPFVVRMDSMRGGEIEDVRQSYKLPVKFYYLPNQLWKHKNHLGIIGALRLIKQNKGNVVIVASGNANDVRHPEYPPYLLSLVREYNLEDRFLYLGFIPYKHILPITRLSIAVVNPSFCEGWSTTVEEAKAIGAPLLLSNLPIHLEQTGGAAEFFDPADPTDIAKVLEECWGKLSIGPRVEAEMEAVQINRNQRARFARDFVAICERVLS